MVMLVIIEGVDGTGKSTLIDSLKRSFSRTVYVFNFSYPKCWEMFQEAAMARGEYYGAVKIFKVMFEKDPDAVIICDRFHLGEFTYGPVKRNYPEWLAEEVLKVEDEILKEIGRDNVRLIITGVSKPEVAMKRSNRTGEYLKDLKEYTEVNLRYSLAADKTKLPWIVLQPDYLNRGQMLKRAIGFITEKLT